MFVFAFLVPNPMLNFTAFVMTLKSCFSQRSWEATGTNRADGLSEAGGGWTEIDSFGGGEGEIPWDATSSGGGDLVGVAMSYVW